jgi:glutathione S-transferase
MPKLYYTPTSCGAASFIVAHTAGLPLACETVDLRAHTTSSGADYYAVNPKGNVPALVLDDGTVLNEGAAVLQWLGDQARGRKRAPRTRSAKRLPDWCPLCCAARRPRARARSPGAARKRRCSTRRQRTWLRARACVGGKHHHARRGSVSTSSHGS